MAVLVNVERDVENIRVTLEGLLHAVAMMDVPIEDEDLPTGVAKRVLAHSSCNADIVEEAEATRFVVLCMVAGGPNDCDCIFNLAGNNCTTGFDGATTG